MAQIPTLEAAPGQDGGMPRKNGKLGVIFLVITLLVLAVGGTAAYFLLSASPSKDKKAAAEEAKHAAPAKGPAIYVALDPPFVVNFEAEQMVRFLQVTVQVMSRDQATIDLVKANDPVVRNDLLLLLGNQTYAAISTLEGKEKLRQHALEAVRKVVTTAGGKGEQIEAIYFTSFVMQ
jgi:flagellar FliL protein